MEKTSPSKTDYRDMYYDFVVSAFHGAASVCKGTSCTRGHLGGCIVPHRADPQGLRFTDDLLYAWLLAGDGFYQIDGLAKAATDDRYNVYLQIRSLALVGRPTQEEVRSQYCQAPSWQSCGIHGAASTPIPRSEFEYFATLEEYARKSEIEHFVSARNQDLASC